MKNRSRACTAIFIALIFFSVRAHADTITLAVASNFSGAMQALVSEFEKNSGHTVKLAYGATGKHYAQIYNGAPFDGFFAADSERPALLEQESLIIPGSRFTYALGQLVLWQPQGPVPDITTLKQGGFRKLAIANPRLAPYGLAAQQMLESAGLWSVLQSSLVQGENIGQTLQFALSGNAELAFVALAQLIEREQKSPSPANHFFWRVAADPHQAIVQQAVLLTEKPAAKAFMGFVKSEQGKEIIERYGYALP